MLQVVELVGSGDVMVDRDRAGSLVEVHPGKDAGQSQAVVAVEVGEADAVHVRAREARHQQLPLGALARIEQDVVPVPPQQVPVVVAVPGRRLTRRTQDHQLSVHQPASEVAMVTR